MAPSLDTTGVALATCPTVVSTFFSYFLTWPARHIRHPYAESGTQSATSLKTLPGNQLRYDEGLRIVRRFLEYGSHYPVEQLQAFTAQSVPIPRYLLRDVATIPESVIDKAAGIVTEYLATFGEGNGIDLVGGKKWWLVRGRPLEGEWLEMRKSHDIRQAQAQTSKAEKHRSWLAFDTLRHPTGHTPVIRDGTGAEVKGDRVILYIHGGAFFFSSLHMHRYQIQRHARKAGARAFVPNYRMAPQYPFPCPLLDCLAAYLYLLDPPADAPHKPIPPSNIIFMGDSAGGGMCLTLLVLIREMGLPMPAAASLLSPWVDLTHSMPSIRQYAGGDYIPNCSFHFRPSLVWPPIPGEGVEVEVEGGKKMLLDEQIQLYCPNTLLTHPAVSPINHGSLGGLCPLYINAGSAELLRDEIILAAHRAADPAKYPPATTTLLEYPEQVAQLKKYLPTKVVLQVFEGACHVATTLSWTRSAKHIYRGVADFNIWAWNAAAEAGSRQPSRAGSAPHLASGVKPLTAASTPPDSVRGHKPKPIRTVSASSAPLNGTAAKHDLQDSALDTDSPRQSEQSSQPTSTSTGPTMAQVHPYLQHVRVQDTSAMSDSGLGDSGSSIDTPPSRSGRVYDKAIRVRGAAPAWGPRSIVAQRVSVHGIVSAMEPESSIPALAPELRDSVGRLCGTGALKKWLAKRAEWDSKYRKELDHYRAIRQTDRAAAELRGFLTGQLAGERVPLTALVGLSDPELARKVGKSVDEPTVKTSMPVLLWMAAGEKADKVAVENQEDKEKEKQKRRKSQERVRRKSMEKERRKSNASASHAGHDGHHDSREAAFDNFKGALSRATSHKEK